MKRDDDLIRDLLFEAETSNQPYLLAIMTINPSESDLKRFSSPTTRTRRWNWRTWWW